MRIGRWRARRRRVKQRQQYFRRVLDQRQFFLLIGRDEIRQRRCPRDFGQAAQFFRGPIGGLQRRREHLDVIEAVVGIVLQRQIGRDRFGMGAAQIDRIEIKSQPIQQRQSGGDHDRGHDQDRDAMPLEEAIDRRQRRIAELLLLTWRIEHAQKRRQ